MKKLLQFILIRAIFSMVLSAEEWDYVHIDYTFENDADVRKDRWYTQGGKLSVLLHRKDVAEDDWLQIPYMQSFDREHYINFALVQQMYTPENFETTDIMQGDRPYAGWLYLQAVIMQTSARHYDAVTFKAGVTGKHSQMEYVQRFIHWLIGSPSPNGWENQLDTRIGIQFDYQHKWRFVPDDMWGIESDIIPFVEGNLGFIDMKATTGAMWRLGYNIPENFGAGPIDEYGEDNVPAGQTATYRHKSKWSYYVNLGVGGSAVLYDYFMDAKTLSGEQLVDKNYLHAFGSYGLSIRYDAYLLSYIRTHYSDMYQTQAESSSFGSLHFSYIF